MSSSTLTAKTWTRCLVAPLAILFTLSGTVAMAAAPLTPDDAVKKALNHSPTLKSAVLEVQRARLKVDGEEKRYTPTLTASLNYDHAARNTLAPNKAVTTTDSDAVSIAVGVNQQFAWGTSIAAELGFSGEVGAGLGPGYGVDLRLSVNQPLLRGLGTDLYQADLRMARLQGRNARTAKQQTASETVRDVLTAYWELWYAQESLHIQLRARETVGKQLSDAMAEVRAGAKAELEVLPLQVELARIDEAVVAAKADIKRRRVGLSQWFGIPTAGEETSVAAVGPELPAKAPSSKVASRAAISRSYQLVELRNAVEQARVTYGVAREGAKVRLDATAWLQVSGLGNGRVDDAFAQFGGMGAVSGGVGLRLEFPTDNALADNESARARLAIDSAAARLEAAEERLAAQTTDLVTSLTATKGRLKLAEATARLSIKSVAGQKTRFDSGAGTALELVVAQQDQREAELRVARARVDLETARLALAHLTGDLLSQAKVR